MKVEVTTWYLQLLSPEDLVAPRPRSAGVEPEIRRVEAPCPEINRFFYREVGGPWRWVDRLPWGLQEWEARVARTGYETWIGTLSGAPAGYFELEPSADGGVEIPYFGVLARFSGQGLGARLLAAAATRGWELGARRVWLHTCSLDDPRALGHYQARGFRVYREEKEWKDLPDVPASP